MKKVSALKAFFVWILGMLSLAIILPVSFGADVCTVVSFPGNRAESRCFTVPENSNGIEVLQKAGLRLLLTSPSQFGRMVCKIDDIGTDISGSFCAFSGEFWNFALR
ncbi:hypothetical protein HYU13_06610, partial [Candidatus Woesearchaeota archaeon]|nr:hypothetical protein [Candidatus Woesearchaeota archaeon]